MKIFKTVLVTAISLSNTKLFTFENEPIKKVLNERSSGIIPNYFKIKLTPN
jgi:hypothetical protein